MNNGVETLVLPEAGRLCWGELRHAVKALKFEGMRIDVLEGRGWLFREFRFRGEPRAIAAIRKLAHEINQEADASRVALARAQH